VGKEERAVQRPEANEGGREEEEKSLRIACRRTDRLHGAKLVAGVFGLPMPGWSAARRDGSLAAWSFAREQRPDFDMA